MEGGLSLQEVRDVSKWHWEEGPFHAEPLAPCFNPLQHTAVIANEKGNLFGTTISIETATAIAEEWNEKAALYCMVEMP